MKDIELSDEAVLEQLWVRGAVPKAQLSRIFAHRGLPDPRVAYGSIPVRMGQCRHEVYNVDCDGGEAGRLDNAKHHIKCNACGTTWTTPHSSNPTHEDRRTALDELRR